MNDLQFTMNFLKLFCQALQNRFLIDLKVDNTTFHAQKITTAATQTTCIISLAALVARTFIPVLLLVFQ